VGSRGYAGWGRGGGFGRGRGFGWGRAGYGWPGGSGYAYPYAGYPSGFGAPPSPEQEKDALKQQAQFLQQSLENIGKRIEELEKEDG
jgi:hypothetical protein